jgi:hypothetical protein
VQESWEVQAAGCLLLEGLSALPDNIGSLVASGACEAVVSAYQAAGDEGGREAVKRAIVALARDDETNVPLGMAWERIILRKSSPSPVRTSPRPGLSLSVSS